MRDLDHSIERTLLMPPIEFASKYVLPPMPHGNNAMDYIVLVNLQEDTPFPDQKSVTTLYKSIPHVKSGTD